MLLTMLAAAGAAVSADTSIFSTEGLIAFLTLAMLEIVLGIDNIVVIAIVTQRLPKEQQPRARTIGLALAMIMRIVLLLFIGLIMKLKEPLFSIGSQGFSGKDLILLGGGLFLIAKATYEIHHKMEGDAHESGGKAAASFGAALAQILMLDLVFSLDSVITAVGMTPHVPIMIAAIITSVAVMMIFSGPISGFIESHPTIKILALSFLLLIGVLLTAEGFHVHMNKNYIYFAMGFSLIVEMINIRISTKRKATAAAH